MVVRVLFVQSPLMVITVAHSELVTPWALCIIIALSCEPLFLNLALSIMVGVCKSIAVPGWGNFVL